MTKDAPRTPEDWIDRMMASGTNAAIALQLGLQSHEAALCAVQDALIAIVMRGLLDADPDTARAIAIDMANLCDGHPDMLYDLYRKWLHGRLEPGRVPVGFGMTPADDVI